MINQKTNDNLEHQYIKWWKIIVFGSSTTLLSIFLIFSLNPDLIRTFDKDVLLMFRVDSVPSDPIGPQWLEETARDFTALGGIPILTLVAFTVFIYLHFRHKPLQAYAVLGSFVGSYFLNLFLKLYFDRSRPDLVPHEVATYTASFPSAHAMMATSIYLTLIILIARIQPRKRTQFFLLSIAIILTILVSLSRVYLGVHWPTDVIVGWFIGALWASAVIAVIHWFEKKK